VPDEFPTLQVALGGSVALLGWRLWLLLGASRRLESDTARAERVLGSGAPPGEGEEESAWLRPLLATAENGRKKGSAPEELTKALGERARREGARLRSRAGVDLVISAVLSGLLVYAAGARLVGSFFFYLLGAIAIALLLASAVVQVRGARALSASGTRLARALARTLPSGPAA